MLASFLKELIAFWKFISSSSFAFFYFLLFSITFFSFSFHTSTDLFPWTRANLTPFSASARETISRTSFHCENNKALVPGSTSRSIISSRTTASIFVPQDPCKRRRKRERRERIRYEKTRKTRKNEKNPENEDMRTRETRKTRG